MDAAPRWCTARPIGAAPGLRRDGTGSGSWSCRRGHTRAVGWRGGRAAAMTFQDAARPGTGRPRLRTRPTVPIGRLACRPARSAFFLGRQSWLLGLQLEGGEIGVWITAEASSGRTGLSSAFEVPPQILPLAVVDPAKVATGWNLQACGDAGHEPH